MCVSDNFPWAGKGRGRDTMGWEREDGEIPTTKKQAIEVGEGIKEKKKK